MKKTISALAAMLTALTLGGCQAASDWIDEQRERIFPEEQTTASENSVSEKPNVINAGVYDMDTYNPLITRSQSVKEAMQLVYEPLYTLDESMRPMPVLAESCEKSNGGRTITLNIKRGVKWHDGSELTAQDVAYTFRMIRSGITNYTENLHHVADYIMTDDYTISITLGYAAPSFESMLTFPIVQYQTDMSVNPEYIPNGTGPFCYGKKSSVDEIYFGAFENYRGGKAKIDAMYLHVTDSREKYMSMLEASEIDFSSGNITDLTEYMPKGSLSLHDYPENNLVFLGFNTANPALSGALTRKGISELINRDDIVDSVIFSRGTASDIPVNPASYLYYGDKREFKADELSANDNFGNDGWGPDEDGVFVRTVNGREEKLSVEILVNADNALHTAVGEAIAAQLTRFGARAEVQKLPYETYMSRIESGSYDMFIGEAQIDGNMELTQLVSSTGNYFAYSNPELDTITAQMGMAADEEELKTLFRQYAEIITADMPFAAIYYKKGSLISSANVTSGINPSYVWLYKDCSSWSVK